MAHRKGDDVMRGGAHGVGGYAYHRVLVDAAWRGIGIPQARSVVGHGVVEANEGIGLAGIEHPIGSPIGGEHAARNRAFDSVVAHVGSVDGIDGVVSVAYRLRSTRLGRCHGVGLKTQFCH